MPQTMEGVIEGEFLEARVINHLRDHIAECRNGDYSGLDCVKRQLELGLVTPEDIDTTHAELNEFHVVGVLEPGLENAKALLGEARDGYSNKILDVVELINKEVVTMLELGLTEDELEELAERHNLDESRKAVEEFRKGDFTKLESLMEGVQAGVVTFQQIGTSKEEMEGFRQLSVVEPAKQYLEEAKAGNFEHFDELRELVNSGTVRGDDLEITQKDLQNVFTSYHEGIAKEILAEARESNFSRFVLIRNGLGNELITLEGLGLTEDEFEELSRQAMASHIKGIADECREGNFSRLPNLVSLQLFGTSMEDLVGAEALEELDLDLEGWMRQDEIQSARHVVEEIRQRRGLSKAGPVDRALLLHFSAEELGLTDDEYQELLES